MKQLSIIIFVFLAGIIFAFISGCTSNEVAADKINNTGLSSEAFSEGGMIPEIYTCTGEGISPPLSWIEPPEGTESLALTLSDPDAPKRTFTHWILWNIPKEMRVLPEDVSDTFTENSGIIQGVNDFGDTGYGASCPPAGPAHRYIFRLYALDFTPDIPPGSNKERFQEEINGHIIAEYDLTGMFGI